MDWPPDYHRLIKEVGVDGCPMFGLTRKVKLLKTELKIWNKQVFGDAKLQVDTALAIVDRLQQYIASVGSGLFFWRYYCAWAKCPAGPLQGACVWGITLEAKKQTWTGFAMVIEILPYARSPFFFKVDVGTKFHLGLLVYALLHILWNWQHSLIRTKRNSWIDLFLFFGLMNWSFSSFNNSSSL